MVTARICLEQFVGSPPVDYVVEVVGFSPLSVGCVLWLEGFFPLSAAMPDFPLICSQLLVVWS